MHRGWWRPRGRQDSSSGRCIRFRQCADSGGQGGSLFFNQKQLVGSMTSDLKDLPFGLELVRDGRVRPVLDRALHSSQEARCAIAANEVAGNLVLLPWAA